MRTGFSSRERRKISLLSQLSSLPVWRNATFHRWAIFCFSDLKRVELTEAAPQKRKKIWKRSLLTLPYGTCRPIVALQVAPPIRLFCHFFRLHGSGEGLRRRPCTTATARPLLTLERRALRNAGKGVPMPPAVLVPASAQPGRGCNAPTNVLLFPNLCFINTLFCK